MNINIFLITGVLILMSLTLSAQTARLKGKITDSEGEPIEWATVSIPLLGLATKADSTGNYELQNIPVGSHQIKVSFIGFATKLLTLTIADTKLQVRDVALTSISNRLNSVVVTGTRTARKRSESPVAVNILDSRTFNITQSNTLADGLCFQPGLRMETDCQTCNYSQLRMNGLGGSYSQVLINSRPVFSSLMSLYGLEQIPANMIDRVEIVRGGGSVLYGSSAIAGTVNILTKQAQKSSFTLSNNSSLMGNKTWDHFLNANLTAVNEEQNAGVSFFASHRNRNSYDANGDGFSEMPMLQNNSFGFNSFFKLSPQDKLEINGWSINEERKGGNKLDLQADKADQSEYRLHNILVGGFNYEHQAKDKESSFSVYGAAQNTKRTHYTGIDQIDAWGHTKNYSIQSGVQYNYISSDFLNGKNTFTSGIENQYEYTFDEIKAYDYLIDQHVNLLGAFLQSDWEVTRKLTVLSGLRLNKSNRIDKLVLTPRLSALYKLGTETQLRTSYARGFKAPQALETDMHMAFAGGGVSVIRTDDNLIAETSNSFNVSLDFNRASEHFIYGFTVDGFFTRLYNTFVLEEIGTDQNNNQQLLRKNGSSSSVRGITAEGRFNYDQKIQLETGLTFQKSTYDEAVSWSSTISGTRKYLRSPDLYGYYTLSFWPQNRFNAVLSGVLTGPMKVPHFAGAPGIDQDVLNTSPTFLENNIKLSYRFTLKQIKQDLQFNIGIQNMFNQYQKDFDIGKNRDSNYIYGPSRPRTFFIGLKFGLM
ncbi:MULTISPECIES: TonB-dependent receptor [Sphingobacterium]|uniref:TonB-dependent receptor n=1 Tax=Sphingobacterium TaxID=28453 RepID=UPI00104F0889|nr:MULTISPECIES: TonB-dependent receptor [Sphingobacterium]MCW2263236.1 outer membrane receptor for ferrienterochelin and colicins [Sphingobacterium kitahiroshimense]TCR11779.1 outer membrane receptor for ferrienterochelin and colicins [Sphingobacterium sp. JUb78]